MELITLIAIALGLSADAFAVSVCNGLKAGVFSKRTALTTSAVFGAFQGLMPLIGYYAGSLFLYYIGGYLPYISFAILAIIGGRMIFGAIKALKKPQENIEPAKFSLPSILLQGVATSIDALAVGVSLLSFSIAIGYCSALISITTFTLCLIAFVLGSKAATIMKNKSDYAAIIGGAVLIIIGITFLIR